MSRATSRPPIPNAIAAANATAPSRIKKVFAVSCTATPSCVNAAKTAYTMIAYWAMFDRMSLPVAPPHDPAYEVRQQGRKNQDQDGGDDARDIGDKLRQNYRDLRDPQGICGHGDGDDEDEPEHERAQDANRGLVGLGPVEELLYAAALHPPVEAYPL